MFAKNSPCECVSNRCFLFFFRGKNCTFGMDSTCFYCNGDAVSSCQACHLVAFCSNQQHKQIHFSQDENGRKKCLPFKVVQDPQKGQCLMAIRLIKPLEMILAELPFVVGPYAWPAKHQCLECFRLITDIEAQKCSKCHYPVCNQRCQNGNWHLLECQVFQSVNHRCDYKNDDIYAKITPLRLLKIIYENKNPSLCESLFTLRDHNVERRHHDPDLWAKHEDRVAPFLVNVCKMAPNVEMVHRVMGILATNSANLDFPEDILGKGYGLFPTFAKVNHHCMANTKNLNNLPKNQLQLRASRRIEKGEEISNLYSNALSNSLERRLHLRSKWHFECLCSRCADPYEMGSNLSTLKCNNCKGNLVSSDPLDSLATWNCDSCQAKKPVQYVLKCIRGAKSRLRSGGSANQDIVSLYERFLHENSDTFHPGHQVMLDVQMHLAVLYGNLKAYSLWSLSHPQLERKLQCINQVLTTLSKVEIGYSSNQGKLLNELMKGKLVEAHRQFKQGQISQEELDKILAQQRSRQKYIAFNQTAYFGGDSSVYS